MRVIDLDDGVTLQAANDEDLFKSVRTHYDQQQRDKELSDEEIRELIDQRAYSATDS